MRKCGLCCRPVPVRASVLLSVRPSVTFVCCIQTAKVIIKLLSRHGSPIILVFLTPSAGTKPQGNLFSGAQNTRSGKICDFPLESPFISETVQDRPVVTMER